MKKAFLFTMLIGVGLVVMSGMAEMRSNGAPQASTNAPGELTCNRSSCHAGNELNAGVGTLSLIIDSAANGQYTLGMTYDVTVAMSQPGIERFGFQMLALSDYDTTNSGEFIVTDDTRTKVIDGSNQYTGRKYMTYKYLGTEPVSPGLGKWNFKWTAPLVASGPVTFYLAAACADNDGTDSGDTIYTEQITLQPDGTSSVLKAKEEPVLESVYPNPAIDQVQVCYKVKSHGVTSLYIADALGRVSQLLVKRIDAPGTYVLTLKLQHINAPGLYFITLINGRTTQTQSLVINP